MISCCCVWSCLILALAVSNSIEYLRCRDSPFNNIKSENIYLKTVKLDWWTYSCADMSSLTKRRVMPFSFSSRSSLSHFDSSFPSGRVCALKGSRHFSPAHTSCICPIHDICDYGISVMVATRTSPKQKSAHLREQKLPVVSSLPLSNTVFPCLHDRIRFSSSNLSHTNRHHFHRRPPRDPTLSSAQSRACRCESP